MLKKLNETKKGKALYLNVLTGETTTLGEAVFVPSMRRQKRNNIKLRSFSNRKNRGEVFLQKIKMGEVTRFIPHYTDSALKRKVAFLNFQNI